jgi:hypothetical protein
MGPGLDHGRTKDTGCLLDAAQVGGHVTTPRLPRISLESLARLTLHSDRTPWGPPEAALLTPRIRRCGLPGEQP